MKEVNLTIEILDDWYYAIEAEYNTAKESDTYSKDIDSFLREFISSVIISELYNNYMDQYIDQHIEYINKKIPDYQQNKI